MRRRSLYTEIYNRDRTRERKKKATFVRRSLVIVSRKVIFQFQPTFTPRWIGDAHTGNFQERHAVSSTLPRRCSSFVLWMAVVAAFGSLSIYGAWSDARARKCPQPLRMRAVHPKKRNRPRETHKGERRTYRHSTSHRQFQLLTYRSHSTKADERTRNNGPR